jgi:hypothetical protein
MRLLALAVLLWGAGLVPASAQPVPSGSYRATCQDIQVDRSRDGPVLSAVCQKANGERRESSIRLRDCRSEIYNDNGRLKCDGREANAERWWRNELPRGSWQQSCRDARVDGNTLRAVCDNGRGQWRATSMDVRRCRDVVNDRGRLSCDW